MIMEDRYARHHLLEGWDQKRLAGARVLVAGVGAVGNEVVKLLALMGVGHLALVDFDAIELSNLTRSVLFREGDTGKSKAAVAAERACDLNPDVKARGLCGDLEFDVGVGVYRAMDVVIGCLDSVNARLALNRACQRAGVPWINTGIEATFAEIALYGGGQGACFECAMSETMWERRNQRFSCGGLRSDLPENAVPTTAIVASLAAAYAVNEALLLLHGWKEGVGCWVLGVGENTTPLPGTSADASVAPTPNTQHPTPDTGLAFGQKLYLTLAPYSLQTVELSRSPECLAHERWEPVTVLSAPAAELTIGELPTLAGMPEGVVELGFDLLTTMRCQNCGQSEAIFKPLEASSLALSQCPACHTPSRQPEVINWIDATSEWANCTLAELSLPEYQILAVKADGQRRYLQISGEYTENALPSPSEARTARRGKIYDLPSPSEE